MNKPAPRTKQEPRAIASSSPQSHTFAGWIGPTVIAFAAVGMMAWTWGTWPDVIVDFGRELYVPWRLSEGEVLYRDLAYFNGPLSPYVNSLLFRLFGVGLRTLVLANFAIFAVLACLWYALLARVGSRVSALLGCLVLVGVFGFARYTIAGNYNYICPYSHEATHGLALATAALWFVARYVRSGRVRDVAVCGFFVGLAFLTKPEIFLAVLPATVVGLLLAGAGHAEPLARVPRLAGAFVGALVVPPFVAVVLLCLALPPGEALNGTLGGWQYVNASEITVLPFYLRSMGVENGLTHLGIVVTMIFWYGMVLGLPAGLGLMGWKSRREELMAAIACFVVVAGCLLWNFKHLPFSDTVRPLPVMLIAILAVAALRWQREKSPAARKQLALVIALVIFALVLLTKIILHVRLTHYGFYLSVPATLLLVVALWDWGPRALEYFDGVGLTLRGAFLAALVVIALRCIHTTAGFLADVTVPVGQDADAFLADSRGNEVNRLLAELDERAAADGTLAVLPEGIMLNYLARRVDPTPYISLMPVEVLMFGEERMLAAFQRQPPDYVILTDEDLQDYGFDQFKSVGDGYADLLAAWFNANYRLLGEARPSEGNLLQAILLEHVAPEIPATPSAFDEE